MYTFNLFCFGHEMAKDKELNNALQEWDFYFRKVYKKDVYELEFPYHGGQVAGNISSCVLGINITDDDGNSNYVNEIRSVKEEDYIDNYKDFIQYVISGMESDVEECEEEYRAEYESVVNKFKKFIEENEPCFYSVEASS